MVGGVRAYDMALRLQYDEVEMRAVQTDLAQAIPAFLEQSGLQPMRIYCTYTAMLNIRKLLNRTHLEESHDE